MAIALVSEVHFAASTPTSSAINTTGATLLVASVSWVSNPITFTDSKGNIWIPLTQQTNSFDFYRIFYCLNPIVGTGHTFTFAGTSVFPGVHVYAFSGVVDYQTQSGTSIAGSGTVSCGSVTPISNGALIITGITHINATTDTVTAGFTLSPVFSYVAGTQVQSAAAYLIQGTAGAINPAWTSTPAAGQFTCVGCAVFLPVGTAEVRVSQLPVEVAVVVSTPVELRISQLPLEIAADTPITLRVTQDVIETLLLPNPAAVVTQYVVEILSDNTFVAPAVTETVQFAIIG